MGNFVLPRRAGHWRLQDDVSRRRTPPGVLLITVQDEPRALCFDGPSGRSDPWLFYAVAASGAAQKHPRTPPGSWSHACTAGELMFHGHEGPGLSSGSDVPPGLVTAPMHGPLFGAPSDAALADVYRDSDLLLFPSFYEGFVWPVLEAMRPGLPVVASNCPRSSKSQGERRSWRSRTMCAHSPTPSKPS